MSFRSGPGLYDVRASELEEPKDMSSHDAGTGAAAAEPELLSLDPATTAVIRGTVPAAGLRDFFDSAFRTLPRVLGAQGVSVRSPAFALFRGVPTDTFDLEVGFVTDQPVRPEDGVVAGSLPGGRAVRLTHFGSFDGLGSSWERLDAWMRAQGLSGGPQRWEVYVTQPSPAMDPRDLRTDLTWPLAG
jgi:effector-binding domain-containing protein